MKCDARVAICLIALGPFLTGCGDRPLPTAASASTAPTSTPTPQPVPVQPVVRAVAPSIGSSDGGAWGTISGADFQPGATVTFGRDGPGQAVVQDTATILFWTGAHAVGAVDVTVTNPGGLSAVLPAGYTYAPPGTFDFNGAWSAHAGTDFGVDVGFEIEHGRLAVLSCASVPVPLPATAVVPDGQLDFHGDDGSVLTGRLVSPDRAVGTIDVAGCTSGTWWADRRALTARLQ